MPYKDKARTKIESDKYYKKNKYKILIAKKLYYQKNKIEIAAYNKIYRKDNKEKLKIYKKEYDKSYDLIYRERRNKLANLRCKNDIDYKIKRNIRTRIYSVLKGKKKSKSTAELLGMSIKDFKIWIEGQFTERMSWDNYGKWHIDHVYPCSLFNLEQPYEQKICFNWFNLQPLWARENLIKSNKLYIDAEKESYITGNSI